MKLFRFLLWWHDTYLEFKQFYRYRKSNFRLRPIVWDFMQRKVDEEEQQAQQAYLDSIIGAVTDDYEKRQAILQSILFPDMNSVYVWFNVRGVSAKDVPRFSEWSVSFSSTGNIGLHLLSEDADGIQRTHTYDVMAVEAVDLTGIAA